MIHMKMNDKVITPSGKGIIVDIVDGTADEPDCYVIQYDRSDFTAEEWKALTMLNGTACTRIVMANACTPVVEVKGGK